MCETCKHLLFSMLDEDCKMIYSIHDIKQYICGCEDSEYYNYQVDLHFECDCYEEYIK